MAVRLADVGPLGDVLQVGEGDAAGVPLEQGHGIAAAPAHPEDVGLEEHEGGIGLRRQGVEERALGRGLELETVDVIDELEPRLAGRAAGPVEIGRRLGTDLPREALLVGDPGATAVARAEGRGPLRQSPRGP